MSDTQIDLKWDAYVGLLVSVTYEICYNTLTPLCVDGLVSVVLYDMKYTKIMYVLKEKLSVSLTTKVWPGKHWQIYIGHNV